MSKPSKLNLIKLIDLIDKPKANLCLKIYQDFKENIDLIPGSLTKHQAWQGGYIAHLEESMNIAVILYNALNNVRQLEFNLSDALFTIFLHDFDKVWRYEKTAGKFSAKKGYSKQYINQLKTILRNRYGYTLSDYEHNALKYVHGEGKDYHPTKRVMNPLATFIHCCDVISARIWFNEGRDSDNW